MVDGRWVRGRWFGWERDLMIVGGWCCSAWCNLIAEESCDKKEKAAVMYDPRQSDALVFHHIRVHRPRSRSPTHRTPRTHTPHPANPHVPIRKPVRACEVCYPTLRSHEREPSRHSLNNLRLQSPRENDVMIVVSETPAWPAQKKPCRSNHDLPPGSPCCIYCASCT